jgi:hypothetical protein
VQAHFSLASKKKRAQFAQAIKGGCYMIKDALAMSALFICIFMLMVL